MWNVTFSWCTLWRQSWQVRKWEPEDRAVVGVPFPLPPLAEEEEEPPPPGGLDRGCLIIAEKASVGALPRPAIF